MSRRVAAFVATVTLGLTAGYCTAPQALYERPDTPEVPGEVVKAPKPPTARVVPPEPLDSHQTEPVRPALPGAASMALEVDWREGWRFEERGVCVELRGPNVQTNLGIDWLAVVSAFRAVGLMLYLRNDGGCVAVPWDQKILVRAYYGNNYGPTTIVHRAYAYVLPWTYYNPSCTYKPAVCIRLAKTEMWLNLDQMRGLTGLHKNAIASHELAHLAGLSHQPASNNTVMGYVNHNVITSTDRVRIAYIFQEVPK